MANGLDDASDIIVKRAKTIVWSTDWSWSISSTNFCDNRDQCSVLHLGYCSCESPYIPRRKLIKRSRPSPKNNFTHNIQPQWSNVSLWNHLGILHSHFLCLFMVSEKHSKSSLLSLAHSKGSLCLYSFYLLKARIWLLEGLSVLLRPESQLETKNSALAMMKL